MEGWVLDRKKNGSKNDCLMNIERKTKTTRCYESTYEIYLYTLQSGGRDLVGGEEQVMNAGKDRRAHTQVG
jgi:hypothetical protein